MFKNTKKDNHQFRTKLKSIYPHFLVIGFFFLLTAIVTYPVILKFRSSIYSYPGDAFGGIWLFWWQKYAFLNNMSPDLSLIVGVPYGLDLTTIILPPIIKYCGFYLTLLVDEIFAYNTLVFLSYPISAITMYFLSLHLTKNKAASTIAAIIFAFSPFRLMKGHGHLGMLLATQWLPLFTLSLLRLNKSKTFRNILFSAIAFSLVVLSDYYAGFFVVILAVTFLFFKIIYDFFSTKRTFDLKFIGSGTMALTICVVLILPFTYNIFQKQVTTSSKHYARPYEDLKRFSARPWNYFVPSIEHPIVGKYAESFIEKMTGWHKSNPVEQTLYLGITPLILALYALIIWRKRRGGDDKENHFSVPFFTFSAIVAILFSAPPIINRFGLSIPMPSYFIYEIVPMFRVYARFGIMVMLSIAALAGIGASIILANRTKKSAFLLTMIIVALVSFEFTNIPPSRVTNVSNIPPVYKWLSKQPGNITIVEYPFTSNVEGAHPGYLLYQRIHKKKLINGAAAETPADELRISGLADFTDQNSHRILRYLGAKYAIVHLDKFEKKSRPNVKTGPTVRIVKKFKNDWVYKITAKPASALISYQDNFYLHEKWSDKKIWRWTKNNAELRLKNAKKQKVMTNLSFKATSFAKPRKVLVKLNNKWLKLLSVSTAKKDFKLKLTLEPGNNTLKFIASPKQQKIGDVINNDDPRIVSIAFSTFRVD